MCKQNKTIMLPKPHDLEHHAREKKRCEKCNMDISYANWSRHNKSLKHLGANRNLENYIKCDKCNVDITKANWPRHLKTKKHLSKTEPKMTTLKETKHKRLHRVFNFSNLLFKDQKDQKKRIHLEEKETAFESRIKTYYIQNVEDYKDPKKFLNRIENAVIGNIKQNLNLMDLKVNLFLDTQYKKGVNEESMEYHEPKNFKTKNEVILKSTNLVQYYGEAKDIILNEMETFEAKGSQWVLHKINGLELRINKYVPFKGGSYTPLPKQIAAKKAVINIKNEDSKCFLWSILAALHPVNKNSERVSHYKKYEHEFDKALKGIEFPIKVTDIDKIEKRINISINVYYYNDTKTVLPLRITKDEKDRHIDLLYIKTSKTEHYCWIKDLWRLVGRQLTKDHKKRYICKRCLNHFNSEEVLNDHMIDCGLHKPGKAILPKPYDNILKFKNWNHSLRVPFVIYADFESMLRKVSTSQPNPEDSYTKVTQKHEARGSVYYIKYCNKDYKPPVVHLGENAGKVFYDNLKNEAINIAKVYNQVVPMIPLEKNEMYRYTAPQSCHICDKSFNEHPPILERRKSVLEKTIKYFKYLEDFEKVEKYSKDLQILMDGCANNMRRVMDHNHLTGEFRGPAHSICNLNYSNPNFIPVFFHNLAGYDAHLFIKELNQDDGKIDSIANTEENYISFTKYISYKSATGENKSIKLRFIDSFKFLSASLDNLSQNLQKEQFRELSKFFPNHLLDLVTKKLAYPYEYMDSEEKYLETELPPIEKFYSTLNKEGVDEKEYQNAKDIWEKFKVKNLQEFTELYNKVDVLLLADIMENFRDISLKTYKLDPAWYFTTPGFAWDAMLKLTKVELELLTDIKKFLMVEQGIRGGITQCSNRYAKANNKYMGDKYNPKNDSIYLGYFDANNEYGWSMMKYLPYGDFKWTSTNIDVTKVSDESNVGYILEVDLEYPKELHDDHSDFPLAPENIMEGKQLPKLFTTLYDKTNYVIHYSALKYYLAHGLKLSKVHRVLQFKQAPWLRPYIELNTKLRSKAEINFEKDFFKLMNNAVYGKTMENIRNRVDIRLCSNNKQVEKLVAKPNFKGRTIFDENLVAVHMEKSTIILNKPIYVGMTILETSKLCLYEFWYDVLKRKYGKKIKLYYEDTDSLIFSVRTEDFYLDLHDIIDKLDTSDYPIDNIYGLPRVNKKVLGKFKDELNGKILEEFVGLKSKCYALNVFENKNLNDKFKKVKGIKKSVVKNEITFADYKKCLFTKTQIYRKQNLIRSKGHELYTIEMNKKALNSFDDKRHVHRSGIKTTAWGHHKLGIERSKFIEHLNGMNKENH